MTEIITGKDAEIILDEMRNGTPNTEKRIETIRRADEIFCKMNSTSEDVNMLLSALERILEVAEMKRKEAERTNDDVNEGMWGVVETIAWVAITDYKSISEDVKENSNGPEATE